MNLLHSTTLKKSSKKYKLSFLLNIARVVSDREKMKNPVIINKVYHNTWICPVCKKGTRRIFRYGKRFSCTFCKEIKEVRSKTCGHPYGKGRRPTLIFHINFKKSREIRQELAGEPFPEHLIPSYISFLTHHACTLNDFFILDKSRITRLEELIK